MTAIGYIRQSRRADLDVALSRYSQLAAIQRMATADGVDVQIMEDLGRSGGRGKERLRPAYQQLLSAIEAGGVDAVYAISLTRLARSTSELIRVADLAQDHGVRLVILDGALFGAGALSGNSVRLNWLSGNTPNDIYGDGTGTTNTISGNTCTITNLTGAC